MGWLLLVAFESVTFALLVGSADECLELARLNRSNFDGAIMVCAKAWEV